MVGPKKQDFWPKINICSQGKPIYFENMGSTSSSKIGHDFRKFSGSKVGDRKKCFLFIKNGLLN